MNVQKLISTWWMMRMTYGLLFVIAGADKFLNLVTTWIKYVSPMVAQQVPLEAGQLMLVVAGIEIVIGLMILTCCARFGGYLAMLWLLIIAANLLSMGNLYYDIAVRDVVMAVGALALANLTSLRSEAIKNI